jgi:hypothetical protein
MPVILSASSADIKISSGALAFFSIIFFTPAALALTFDPKRAANLDGLTGQKDEPAILS